MKSSHVPHLDILGAPIGDYLFCAAFRGHEVVIQTGRSRASDTQVTLILLRLCVGHLARSQGTAAV